MRDGNPYFYKTNFPGGHISFRSDYEGWKLVGNNNVADFAKDSRFRSDYEGWKLSVNTSLVAVTLVFVLEVTMRDGNGHIPYLNP